MPSTLALDPGRRLVTLVLTGALTIDDLDEVRARMVSHPAFDPAFGFLVDVSAADLRGLDVHALRERAPHPPVHGPLALVADSEVAFGVSRMYELAGEGTRAGPVAVFRDREAALAWIGRVQAGGKETHER